MIGEGTNTLAGSYGLIALIHGFSARLQALESKFEEQLFEARSTPERDQSELARLEWELRAGLAEITVDVEDSVECGCTVARW